MKKHISIAVLAALGAISQAQASITVNINPDAGGVDPTLSVGALDWTVGSALSVADTGSITYGAYAGQQFTTYAHGSLATFNNKFGTPIGGINLNGYNPANQYEWTFVAGFREKYTAVGAADSSFVILGNQPSFFEIWFDATRNANNLTGKGFNDGIKILSGHFTGGAGGFTVTPQAAAPLDQFDANDYPNQQTITGNGSSTGGIDVDWVNATFFPNAPLALTIDFTSQQKLAFGQTDPSACFWTGSTYVGGAGNVAEGCAHTIGSINGANGNNIEFQIDASNSFSARKLPEPGSIALLGLGFAAASLIRRKKLA